MRRTASSSRCTAAASSAWRAASTASPGSRRSSRICARSGFEGTIETLTPEAAREIEPSLGDDARFVVRTSVDRYVRPESLMAGLAAKLRGRGVELREQVDVTACSATAPAGRSRRATGAVEAEAVVVTAGAATPPLLRPFGLRVPIVAAKGYSLTLQGEGVPPRTALYLCEPKIGVSGFDGGVRIAGTFELPGRDLDVDRKRIGYILDDALPFIRGWKPAPGEAETHGWAGFRPATPDSLPLLGPMPGRAASSSPPATACSASRSRRPPARPSPTWSRPGTCRPGSSPWRPAGASDRA